MGEFAFQTTRQIARASGAQAGGGWALPYAVTRVPNTAFAIFLSPAAVNPFDQAAYSMKGRTVALGASEAEARHALEDYRAVTEYYSGRVASPLGRARKFDARRTARIHTVQLSRAVIRRR